MSGVSSVFLLAEFGFAMYLIYLNLLTMLIHALLHSWRNTSSKIQKLHAKIGSYLYWDGLNRLYMELFFDLAFLSALNVYTIDWSSKFMSVRISNVLSFVVLILVNGVLILYTISYFRLNRVTRTK